MSGIPELAGLYSALEESSRLVDADCSRDTVWPILTAYGDSLAQAVIAFRVSTGARGAGELDCRFTIPSKGVDPYALAVSTGLLPEADHSVGSLLSDIAARYPIDCYAIDFGVVDGFKKIWSFFPPDGLQGLAGLAGLPSMPLSVAENLWFFNRHGLTEVSLIGVDYPSRTLNLYFGEIPRECFAPETIVSMHREIKLPDPSEQLLGLGAQSFGIYTTLGWDSPRIERLTFSTMTQDVASLPIRLDPKIEHFVKHAPSLNDPVDRRFVYAIAATDRGEYHKLQSYYRWRPQMLEQMLLADAVDDAV
jgi:hypothetical protein